MTSHTSLSSVENVAKAQKLVYKVVRHPLKNQFVKGNRLITGGVHIPTSLYSMLYYRTTYIHMIQKQRGQGKREKTTGGEVKEGL
jgi:hypothetical protein